MRLKVHGYFLVALLLLVALSGYGEEEVRVFSLQPDIWEAPRNDVFLRFNMSLQQVASSLTEMTVCSRVFQTAFTKLQVFLSYATAEKFANAIMMYIVDDAHFFRYNNKPQKPIESVKLPMALQQWRHYCHVLSGDTYTVYVNGKALASGPIEVNDRVLPLNGTFIIGQEQDGLSRRMDSQQIIKGYVTQISVWNYGIGESDVAAMADCKRLLHGNIFSSDRDDVELLNANESSVPLSDLCSRDENFIVFPEVRTFSESVQMCGLVGLMMYGPTNRQRAKEVNNTLHSQKFCGYKENVWLGLTDKQEEGTWRRLSDGKIVTDIIWTVGQPDNTRIENCIIEDGVTGNCNDYNCFDNEKACVPCEESQHAHLYLRGMCVEMKTETMFETRGYVRNKPYFHGFYGFMIFKSADTQWVLYDTVSNETLALLDLATSNLYPLGRHTWQLLEPMCDKAADTMTEMSLSACGEKHYMCDSGQCIDVEARCDAKDDCDDETDEDNCSILEVPEGYRSFKPPKNAEEPGNPLEPDVLFQFVRFLEIDDVLEAIQLEFVIQLTWMETRFKYYNLDEDMYANMMSAGNINQTWRPSLKFPNIKGGDLNLLEENLFVKKISDPLPVNFNTVDMSQVYAGTAAMIVQSQHYSGSFNCKFDVFYYPLDAQDCKVLVQLASVSKELVSFASNKSNVTVDQQADISTYIVDRFVVKANEDDKYRESRLQVKFTLTRRYLLIMLSVYLPSAMLLAVGYCTLFVRLEKLDVRLSVSLTTLLVLYTFFSQTSSSLPKTAYVKMIDVWFFFCTFLLFFIIMIHVVVEVLDDGKVFYIAPSRGKFRRPHMSPNSVLIFTRLVAVPVSVFVFSCVYWAMMLV